MSLALNIMVAMKDFSRKWLVVKICQFTGFTSNFTLGGYMECYNDYTHIYYRNKRHIRVLYDGFKLSSGCILKSRSPKG